MSNLLQLTHAPPDDSNDDTDTNIEDTLDVGTEKPMRKGMVFFKSGHVQEMRDCIVGSVYFCRSKCLSSYVSKKAYDTCVGLSNDSGYVRGASCNCRASAMGRCNHIAALLFALLDWSKTKIQQQACTSLLCEWNKGRKSKQAKPLHNANYDSVGLNGPPKRRKRDADEAIQFDPRPVDFRAPPAIERVNELLINLRRGLGGEKSMWENVIP